MNVSHPDETRFTCGTVFSVKRIFNQAEFNAFGQLSGDNNPIHVNPDFAATTRFGHTVAHGMMLYSAVHGLIANHFPNWQQHQQNLMFPAPTFADDEMEVSLEIVNRTGEDTLDLITQVRRVSDGQITCDGQTTLVKNRETAS